MTDVETGFAPAGYVSEEARRKFTLTAGILGAVFFIAQMVAPIALMPFLLLGMSTGAGSIHQRIVGAGAFWNESLWLPEQTIRNPAFSKPGDPDARLARLPTSDGGAPVKVVPLDAADTTLLLGTDGLWAISSESVTLLGPEGRVVRRVEARPGEMSPPFMHLDRPAVLAASPGRVALVVWRDDAWREEVRLGLHSGHGEPFDVGQARCLSEGGRLHVFMREGETVFHAVVPLEPGAIADVEWKPVGRAASWGVSTLDGHPSVFGVSSSGSTVKGWRWSGDAWSEFTRFDTSAFSDNIGVYPTGGQTAMVVCDSMLGRLRLIEVGERGVVRRMRVGEVDPFFRRFFLWIPLIYVPIVFGPIVLAVVLSSLMRRYRTAAHAAGDSTLVQASLARRAVAELVDVALLAGPMVAGYGTMFASMFDLLDGDPKFLIGSLALLFGGFFWAFVLFLVFCGLEGKWGRTPGKWLTGIRVVGTDHAPCGFGRSLVRNLLRFVDGFFCFLVGVMVAALTENWQRIGDLAARTIVVEARERRPGS